MRDQRCSQASPAIKPRHQAPGIRGLPFCLLHSYSVRGALGIGKQGELGRGEGVTVGEGSRSHCILTAPSVRRKIRLPSLRRAQIPGLQSLLSRHSRAVYLGQHWPSWPLLQQCLDPSTHLPSHLWPRPGKHKVTGNQVLLEKLAAGHRAQGAGRDCPNVAAWGRWGCGRGRRPLWDEGGGDGDWRTLSSGGATTWGTGCGHKPGWGLGQSGLRAQPR